MATKLLIWLWWTVYGRQSFTKVAFKHMREAKGDGERAVQTAVRDIWVIQMKWLAWRAGMPLYEVQLHLDGRILDYVSLYTVEQLSAKHQTYEFYRQRAGKPSDSLTPQGEKEKT